jgi:hypothetical protein
VTGRYQKAKVRRFGYLGYAKKLGAPHSLGFVQRRGGAFHTLMAFL